jgi:hypothetical protein
VNVNHKTRYSFASELDGQKVEKDVKLFQAFESDSSCTSIYCMQILALEPQSVQD